MSQEPGPEHQSWAPVLPLLCHWVHSSIQHPGTHLEPHMSWTRAENMVGKKQTKSLPLGNSRLAMEADSSQINATECLFTMM